MSKNELDQKLNTLKGKYNVYGIDERYDSGSNNDSGYLFNAETTENQKYSKQSLKKKKAVAKKNQQI